jgi:hypothetical protein
MKIRTSAVARRAAVVPATLAALIVPVAAHAAACPVSQAPLITHSPSGSCLRATLLAYQDRHVLSDSTHLAGAFGAALTHRHAACPAVVDYLKQMEA